MMDEEMNFKKYIQQKKKLYNLLINYIENETDYQDEYAILLCSLEKQQIEKDQYELKEFLVIISNIAENHYHCFCFIEKIEQIIMHYKNDIIRFFSNIEIYKIFKSNKRILLLLIEKKILILEETLVLKHILKIKYFDFGHFVENMFENLIVFDEISRTKYFLYLSKLKKNAQKYMQNRLYFYPEIKPFVNKKILSKLEKILFRENPNILVDFDEKRKIGENDSYICNLIRNDNVIDFISYVNRNNISLSKTIIKPSIFETNSFLQNNHPSLIEYSAFFGSIEIFQYLRFNNVELKPSLWLYAIHGNSPEIIHLLEENSVNPYEKCLCESIKCHHNNIADYLQVNYSNLNIDDFFENHISFAYRYHNYNFISKSLNTKYFYFYVCQFNYITFVKRFIKEDIENLNQSIILINF